LSSILYYPTPHGFGHTVRSVQVIRALKRARPDLAIHVRTTAPEWLIQHPVLSVRYYPHSLDVGMVQRDSLAMELSETLQACQALRVKAPKLVEREIDFVRHNHIQMILGDIPALCFEIAAQASLPSVAVTNFIWSWIYRAYLRKYPDFLPVIEEMERFYAKATLALALPYSAGMEGFPLKDSIPWISRTSTRSKDEAREHFRLPRSGMIVLISFGGIGVRRLPWAQLKRSKDFVFVTTGEVESHDGNVFVLGHAQRHYEDLVRAADVVITKPGYGIVADIIAHQVPALYTDRGDFPEYPFLVRALGECATVEFISQDELLAGNLLSYLQRLLEKKSNWPSVPLNGADVAAKKILSLLDHSS
jgi:L-arabinokinase